MKSARITELPGLKGNNPLGFLAACGLLRSCAEGTGTESSQTKLAWTRSHGSGTFIAVLLGEKDLDVASLAAIVNAQCEKVRRSAAFAWSSKIDDPAKFRKTARDLLAAGADGNVIDALALLAALASDIVISKGALVATMFDLTSGNQRFLDSIRALAGQVGKADKGPTPIQEEAVREAVLGPWQYRDDHHALGWDPATQRLHALRHKLPEKDKSNRSVRAAVFLATQALALFPCFAVGGRLYTTAFRRVDDEERFSWPIWHDPISLDTLRSLLAHPFTAELRGRGVEVVYECRRIRTGGAEGNYQVFSHAQERPWPGRHRDRR